MARPARVVVRTGRPELRPVCYRAQRVTFPFFHENPRSNPPIDAIVRGKSAAGYLRDYLALVSCGGSYKDSIGVRNHAQKAKPKLKWNAPKSSCSRGSGLTP